MPKYLEGNTYTIDGVKKIYQPDGTFRDASLVDPPKPPDYVDVPTSPIATEKTVSRTAVNENPSNPGTTTYYSDGTSTFTPAATNPQGLTVAGMVAKANETPATTPVNTTDVKYNSDGTRVLSGTEKEIADYYTGLKPKTADEIAKDEEAIRQRKLEQQNQAISSINQMYDNLLAQINVDNKSRLGSAASINALSGQRGSASGAANEVATRNKNEAVIKANENERNAKIEQVRNDYQTKISDEITKAKELRTNDANAWIKYQTDTLERNKQTSVDLRKAFIAAGAKPEELSDDDYKEIATNGGYTVDQAKAIYKSEYDSSIKLAVQAEEKRVAELEKTRAETTKLKADANAKSDENILINKGYVYVSTPEQRDALKASGKIITEKNGKTYVAPSTLKTKVITKGSNQVLIDMDTGEEIKNLGPKPSGVGSSEKNYTATTIPAKVKSELLSDKASGASIDELFSYYPDVSTSYIQSLFADPNRLAF